MRFQTTTYGPRQVRSIAYAYNTMGQLHSHRRRAYRDGSALDGHTKSAHGGQFVESCAACNEIKMRQERLVDAG